jgi:hypothetical protein
MFHYAWRNFQILVYLTFLPLFLIELLPLGQFIHETLLSVSIMSVLLIFIHGMRIAYHVMRPGEAWDPRVGQAISGLYDMESGFDG